MARILAAGIFVVIALAVMVVAFGSGAEQAMAGQPTDTPTPSATPTDTPTTTATPTPTTSVSASASPTASAAQPAAVPQTGGEPTGGSLSLDLLIALGTVALLGTAGLFAASYALTRRS